MAHQLSRLKRFYIIFKQDSKHSSQYCVVEASIHMDAEIYAQVYFEDDYLKVLSSSQWWEYKQKNKHLRPVNPEKEEHNVN